jgi:Zn-dependent protease with chaperone function
MRLTRLTLVRSLLALSLLLPFALTAHASETPAEHAANVYAQQELDAAPVHGNIPDYTLSPADLAKAQHLSTIHTTLHFVEEAWGIVSLLLLLVFGVIGWMQRTALKASGNRWAQGYLFLLLFFIANNLLSLPFDLYSQSLSRQYGLSVQSWASWFGDLGKSFLISWIVGGLLVMLLFWIIRKFPKRWWLLFWGFSIPIILFGIFVSPYVEPLFNKYEPLQKSNPALVARLEEVVAKTHMDIPPERMFLMKASEKTTTLNADVEGFGHSKRVVVWDTTIAKATPDEIAGIFGHESGHYALGHIEQLVLFLIGTTLVTLFLGYHFIQWAIAKFGVRWGIPAQSDWAALAVLLLAFSIFGLLTEPIQNSFIRMHEHDADVYGQEIIHGLVANPQETMQHAFTVLGTVSFADPNPSQLFEFWTYSHPSIGRRAAFSKAYDPWAPGMEPKYFKK